MEDEIEQPSHCWVRRTLYKHGRDSETSTQLLHFEDPDDEAAIVEAFLGILVDYGEELGLEEFSPIHMDVGRWVIESEEGFSVVEIDPGWTEEQVDAMDAAMTTELDSKVWGGIFTKDLPSER